MKRQARERITIKRAIERFQLTVVRFPADAAWPEGMHACGKFVSFSMSKEFTLKTNPTTYGVTRSEAVREWLRLHTNKLYR